MADACLSATSCTCPVQYESANLPWIWYTGMQIQGSGSKMCAHIRLDARWTDGGEGGNHLRSWFSSSSTWLDLSTPLLVQTPDAREQRPLCLPSVKLPVLNSLPNLSTPRRNSIPIYLHLRLTANVRVCSPTTPSYTECGHISVFSLYLVQFWRK